MSLLGICRRETLAFSFLVYSGGPSPWFFMAEFLEITLALPLVVCGLFLKFPVFPDWQLPLLSNEDQSGSGCLWVKRDEITEKAST